MRYCSLNVRIFTNYSDSVIIGSSMLENGMYPNPKLISGPQRGATSLQLMVNEYCREKKTGALDILH